MRIDEFSKQSNFGNTLTKTEQIRFMTCGFDTDSLIDDNIKSVIVNASWDILKYKQYKTRWNVLTAVETPISWDVIRILQQSTSWNITGRQKHYIFKSKQRQTIFTSSTR